MRAAAAAAAALICVRAAAASAADGDPHVGETGPLVLLVQGDGLLASAPAQAGDPPQGASLRLRRVRAGADLAARSFRVRALLEAQPADAFGDDYDPVAGGRIAGPLRAPAAFASWAPHRVFHLDAGVVPVPFSLTRQVGDAELRLPERAAFARTLAPDVRAGAAVGGDLGALVYAAAVMSASRTLDGDLFDRGTMVAVRLAGEPIGPVGTTPWRRAPDDPWTDWFRFRLGASLLYGTLFEPRTWGLGADLSAQWRRFVGTAEYIFVRAPSPAPSGDRQGAAIEPGLTLLSRRLDLVARGEWERAAAANGWGAGAAVTLYAPDPRARLQAGFERRTGPAPAGATGYALLRLTITTD
jgi:hypothetical protein